MLQSILVLDNATVVVVLDVFTLVNELVGSLLFIVLELLTVLSKPVSVRVVNSDTQVNVLLDLLFLEDLPELTELARGSQRKSLLIIGQRSVLTQSVDADNELLSVSDEIFVGKISPLLFLRFEDLAGLDSSFFGFLLTIFKLLALSFLRVSLFLLTSDISKSSID